LDDSKTLRLHKTNLLSGFVAQTQPTPILVAPPCAVGFRCSNPTYSYGSPLALWERGAGGGEGN